MPSFEPRFINRSRELSSLKTYCSSFRALPLYLYGPEGCGKTRLLREFVKRFNEFFGSESIAIYIDALEERDIEYALLTSVKWDGFFKIGLDVVRDFLQASIPLGQALSRSISKLVNRIAKEFYKGSLEDKYVLIVVDDVTRAIGLNRIEWYIKWLYELMWKLAEEYRPKAINIIATTSEGLSRRLVERHSYASIELIWNLDKESFKELFYELNPPSHVDFSEVWKILGGNPRKLLELARRFNWNIKDMLVNYSKRLHGIVSLIARDNLLNELELVLEDIDNLEKIRSKEIGVLENILEENNLVLYKYSPTIIGSEVEEDSEVGIGKYYAWQTPLYRVVLEKILNEIK